MTQDEAAAAFDLAFAELVAEGLIVHVGGDKWLLAEDVVGQEESEQPKDRSTK